MFNKSLFTNLSALLISIIGILISNNLLKTMGFYALSGAITNWLAIIMLFDKIPLIYGSGVIARQFNVFKSSIKNIILKQFFHHKYIDEFLLNINIKNNFRSNQSISLYNNINYDELFDNFIEIIMESQFGNIIQSFLGGKEALESLRDIFKDKMKKVIIKISSTNTPLNSSLIVKYIEQIVNKRLNELTPLMVKKIVEEMISKYLGWLVLWGGVFGAIIGGITTCIAQ